MGFKKRYKLFCSRIGHCFNWYDGQGCSETDDLDDTEDMIERMTY